MVSSEIIRELRKAQKKLTSELVQMIACTFDNVYCFSMF